jgi:hypothetical protein
MTVVRLPALMNASETASRSRTNQKHQSHSIDHLVPVSSRAGPTTYEGECFCGAVKVEVSGEPEAMGYCHYRSCRSWSGGPVNAFTLWKPDAVRITAGAEHVSMYKKTPATAQWNEVPFRKSPDRSITSICQCVGQSPSLLLKLSDAREIKLRQQP